MGTPAEAPWLQLGGEQLAITPALPGPTALISPAVLTLATASCELEYVSVAPVMGLPAVSITVGESCTVVPAAPVNVAGVRVMEAGAQSTSVTGRENTPFNE